MPGLENASINDDYVQGNASSFQAHVSDDGRYVDGRYVDGRCVVFASNATNLVTGDSNNQRDIFVFDRHSGMTERVSLASGGRQGNGLSDRPSVSADGRFVAYNSASDNLVAGDNSAATDIFVYDRETETVSGHSPRGIGNGSILVDFGSIVQHSSHARIAQCWLIWLI